MTIRGWRGLRATMVLGVMLAGFASPAYAGTVEGKVKSLVVRASDGLHYVVIEGAFTDRAACAQNTSYWMITDEHSDAGKSQLAMLLSAYMSGKSVLVQGTGSCNRWTDGEDILVVLLR